MSDDTTQDELFIEEIGDSENYENREQTWLGSIPTIAIWDY